MFDEMKGLATCVSPRMMTVRERMAERKRDLETQLANVNDALALMDKMPEFEKIHDAITKAGY